MIRIRDIKIRENLTEEQVFQKAISKNKIRPEDVEKWYIQRKSIDARKKEDIYYNYTIDLALKDKKKEDKYEQVEEYKFPEIKATRNSSYNPVIINHQVHRRPTGEAKFWTDQIDKKINVSSLFTKVYFINLS